ncbi:MAG: YceH family protein [Acidobacteriota bacterium]|nr:YceH family protein [Acidobacteriota bacterium]
MELKLDLAEKRVLGALVEKEITTPDYYPLSLNALLAACNQRSNRDPVMDLDEESVRGALSSLEAKGLASAARGEGRVARFEHHLGEVLNLGRRETALLCTLLLRGAQTPGELRGRSERMHHIEDLDEVQLVLQKLIEHTPPLARLLPRQPGTKEARYADALGPLPEISAAPEPPLAAADGESSPTRLAALEQEVATLRRELEELRGEFNALRGRLGE